MARSVCLVLVAACLVSAGIASAQEGETRWDPATVCWEKDTATSEMVPVEPESLPSDRDVVCVASTPPAQSRERKRSCRDKPAGKARKRCRRRARA